MKNKGNNIDFSTKVNGFLNGGDSKYSKAGMSIGLIVKKAIKYMGISVISLAVISTFQFIQYSSSVDHIREAHFSAWESKGETYKWQVSNVRDHCYGSREDKPKLEIISYYDCLENYGSSELSVAMKSADDLPVSAPLKWL